MHRGSSDQVRAVASERYIRPAIQAGKTRFSVAVKDLKQDLMSQGFPSGNTPQICTALQAKSFLRENGLEVEAVDGPPSKLSTTVVVHYRVVAPDAKREHARHAPGGGQIEPGAETPEEWAHRMTGKLFGLMKDEFAAFGGGEAFLRWVRSEDEDADEDEAA